MASIIGTLVVLLEYITFTRFVLTTLTIKEEKLYYIEDAYY